MKKNLKLTMCLMLFTVLHGFAGSEYLEEAKPEPQSQSIVISGTVTDENGESLPGVSVIIKGTAQGTVTDVSGNFQLEVPDRDQILRFSYIGMVSQEVAIGNQSVINVSMVPDATSLEEVVVIGYGTQSKANVTGSLAVVSVDNLRVNPKGRVTESMQGLASGVDVYNSNVPGQDAKIRIHGLGTINNNDPLWVIDGIPVSTYRSNVSNTYYPIRGGNTLVSGFALGAFGNPLVKWETTVSKTIGIDIAFSNRVSATIDLWQKDTKDMLYQELIPAVVGNGTAPSVNVGDMQNRGIDLQLSYHSDSKKDFKYSATLNFSHFKNEIVKLSSKETETLRGFSYREFPIVQSEKGRAFPSFYGYDVVGLFQSQDEASAYAPQFGGAYNKAGQFKFGMSMVTGLLMEMIVLI